MRVKMHFSEFNKKCFPQQPLINKQNMQNVVCIPRGMKWNFTMLLSHGQ